MAFQKRPLSQSSDASSRTWTRLIRFISTKGDTLYGEPTDPTLDIGLAMFQGQSVTARVWSGATPWDANGEMSEDVAEVKELLSPVDSSMCGTIRAIGLNYKAHAAELAFPIPPDPVVFFKPPSALAGPLEPIPIPKTCQNESMDYEVELALALGPHPDDASRVCKDISEDSAMDWVVGFTCANDLTNRVWQRRQRQWGYAKGFDKFCPLGPCLVSPHSFDPSEITLETHLNGEKVQEGRGSDTIFSIPRIISFLSAGTTLPPGTVILTGTPPGMGDSKDPKVWLRDGNEVRCSISHGIGSLVNTIEYQ